MNEGGALSPEMVKYEKKRLEKKSEEELKLIISQYNKPIYSSKKSDLIDQIIRILQEHNKESEKTHSKSSLKLHIKNALIISTAAIAIYILYVAIFGIFKIKISRKVNEYCDTGEIRSKCIRCPSYAICKNGIAKCEEDRDLINGHCLINDEDITNVSALLNIALNSLHKKAGDFKCGNSEVDYLEFDEIDAMLFKKQIIPIDSYDRILKKTMLQLKSEVDITTKVEETHTYYVSLSPKESALCSFKNYTRTQVGTFLLLILCVCLMSFAFVLGKKQRRDKFEAKNLAIQLISKMHNYSAEIDQAALTELFSDDKAFTNAYWPLIFFELEHSPLVTSRKKKGITYYRFVYK